MPAPAEAGRVEVFDKKYQLKLRSPQNEPLALCQHVTRYTAFGIPAMMEVHGYALCVEPPSTADILNARTSGSGANVPGGIMKIVDGRQRYYPLSPELFRTIRSAQPEIPEVLPSPSVGDWISGFFLWPLLLGIAAIGGLVALLFRIPLPEPPPSG